MIVVLSNNYNNVFQNHWYLSCLRWWKNVLKCVTATTSSFCLVRMELRWAPQVNHPLDMIHLIWTWYEVSHVIKWNGFWLSQTKSFYLCSRNMRRTTSVSRSFSTFQHISHHTFEDDFHDQKTVAYCMCVFVVRYVLWGPAAVEHHKARKSLGPSLWQKPSSEQLLSLLTADMMLNTVTHFPQQRRIILQVTTGESK